MKTVTLEQFMEFDPCWLKTDEGRERLRRIAALRPEWTAIDVLNLPDVSEDDKLWAVLREEFIDAPILHEFACRCAEYALLSVTRKPNPRYASAIDAKRKWVRGEISCEDLLSARLVADDAANRWCDIETAVGNVVWSATLFSARVSAYSTARMALYLFWSRIAMNAVTGCSSGSARAAAWNFELNLLNKLLKEEPNAD